MTKDYSAPRIFVRSINYDAVMQTVSVVVNGGSNSQSGAPKAAESKTSFSFDTDDDFIGDNE